MRKVFFCTLSFLLIFSLSPFVCGATTTDPIAPLNQGDFQSPVSDFSGVISVMKNIVQWTYTIFFIVAVFFFLLAAYNYMTGGGSEDKIKKANKQITYGVIAVIVALLASGVSALVYNFISDNS